MPPPPPRETVGDALPGIEGWLLENIAGVRAPVSLNLIEGGYSNLTFCLEDAAGRRLVLRRPPAGRPLPTAHDMVREHTILTALRATPVPAPRVLALCEDPGVAGAAFYVMEFVEGVVLHTAAEAAAGTDEGERQQIGESFIDVLGELHRVDADAVGLGALGRREGYLARQLRRWRTQFHQTTPDAALVDEIHDRLAEAVPRQQSLTLVHGDYRLGNCIVAEGAVRAVVDWEIATLGDPLADVGYVMATWIEPGEKSPHSQSSPSSLPGFPRRADLLAAYERRTGLDLSRTAYYTCMAYWKLACIAEGVRARNAARGDASGDAATEIFAQSVGNRLAAAAALLNEIE